MMRLNCRFVLNLAVVALCAQAAAITVTAQTPPAAEETPAYLKDRGK